MSPFYLEEAMATEEKNGVIVRLNDQAGFGYVQEEHSTRKFIFGFDNIPGYRGQSARQMKLHDGAHVHFQLEGERVKELQLTED
jgi:hypothetical protein